MALNGDTHPTFSLLLWADGEGAGSRNGSRNYGDAPSGERQSVQRAAGEGVEHDPEEEALDQESAWVEVAVGRGEGPAEGVGFDLRPPSSVPATPSPSRFADTVLSGDRLVCNFRGLSQDPLPHGRGSLCLTNPDRSLKRVSYRGA